MQQKMVLFEITLLTVPLVSTVVGLPIPEWTNFTEFCSECVMPSECWCYFAQIYFIRCDNNYTETEFPVVFNNVNPNCTNFTIVEHGSADVAIAIYKYNFTHIPPYAIQIRTRNSIRIYLDRNLNLYNISPAAFDIDPIINAFGVYGSAITQIPTTFVNSFRFPSYLVMLELSNNIKLTNITTLEPFFHHMRIPVGHILLEQNSFRFLPAGLFSYLVILFRLSLNNNMIGHLPTMAFHDLTLNYRPDSLFSITGNPIFSADAGAFTDVVATILAIELSEGGDFSVEMLQNCIIQQIEFGLFNDSRSAVQQNKQCFADAPQLCTPSLYMHTHCNDVLEQLNCNDQPIDLTVDLSNYGYNEFHTLGTLNSPAQFSKISIISQSGSICFNGSQLDAKYFHFNNTDVCDISLKSIRTTAREVFLVDWPYDFIPTVFLGFEHLQRLDIQNKSGDQPFLLNCTCALANAFYDFVQNVGMWVNCIDGTPATGWILDNHARCANDNSTLPEHHSVECALHCSTDGTFLKTTTSTAIPHSENNKFIATTVTLGTIEVMEIVIIVFLFYKLQRARIRNICGKFCAKLRATQPNTSTNTIQQSYDNAYAASSDGRSYDSISHRNSVQENSVYHYSLGDGEEQQYVSES